MKKLFAILTVCLLLFSFCGAAYPSPTKSFYANDYADVLSDSTEQDIVSQSASLAKETGAQLVVLTVTTLENEEPAEYALHAGREWGIGDKEKNNGVLILLCPNEGQIYVAVGRGLEGALNDAKVGRMIDHYAIPAYQSKDFDSGTHELYKAVLSTVLEEYGLEGLEGYEEIPEEKDGGSIIIMLIFLALLLLMGGGGGMFFGRRRGFRGGFGGFTGGGFGGGGFGGGGFSGGSGFGGGGFSGGGGSFGGGGAGRSF